MSDEPYTTIRFTTDDGDRIRVERCDYEDVAFLKSKASREHAIVKDSRNTWWFRTVNEDTGETIGTCGILWRDGGFVRFKSMYLLPEWRGKGIGGRMYQHRVDCAIAEGASAGEGFAAFPHWWLNNGFEVIGTRRNGSIHVFRTF